MSRPPGDTTRLLQQQSKLDRSARNDLMAHAHHRLEKLASRMLRGFPTVRRLEDTSDVLNNALARLDKALCDSVPKTSQHFWNLATEQIRRELIDLARYHKRAEGQAGHPLTDHGDQGVNRRRHPLAAYSEEGTEVLSMDDWQRFHEEVANLPPKERDVFGLYWYEDLTQKQIAEQLSVSVRTVKRRMSAAVIMLSRALWG